MGTYKIILSIIFLITFTSCATIGALMTPKKVVTRRTGKIIESKEISAIIKVRNVRITNNGVEGFLIISGKRWIKLKTAVFRERDNSAAIVGMILGVFLLPILIFDYPLTEVLLKPEFLRYDVEEIQGDFSTPLVDSNVTVSFEGLNYKFKIFTDKKGHFIIPISVFQNIQLSYEHLAIIFEVQKDGITYSGKHTLAGENLKKLQKYAVLQPYSPTHPKQEITKDVVPPKITLISPPESRGIAVVPEDYITIIGIAKDESKIASVVIQGEEASLEKIAGGAKFKKEVFIPSEKEEILIQASDEWGNIAKKKIVLRRELKTLPTTSSIPEIWSVIVGVSKYENPELNLRYADSDASSFHKFMLSQVRSERIKFLVNEEATRSNIIAALNEVFERAFENDLVIVYFALHGVPEKEELFFLGHDGDHENIVGTGIAQSDIMRLLRGSRVRRVVFFLDACHSGGFARTFAFRRGIYERNVNRLLKEISKAKPGIAVFSASSASQASIEGERWRGGVFTYYLLRGLKGEADRNRDGFVRLRELYDYVYRKVSKATEGKQYPDLDGGDDLLPLSLVR